MKTPGAFVSTMKSYKVALRFITEEKGLSSKQRHEGYIYTLRTSQGLDVNKILRANSPSPSEEEIALLGNLNYRDILSAQQIDEKGLPIGKLLKHNKRTRTFIRFSQKFAALRLLLPDQLTKNTDQK